MTLHPQAENFLQQLMQQNPPSWDQLSPAAGRRMFASFTELFGPAPSVAFCQDLVFADRVPVRMYRDAPDSLLPAVLYFHGGGWVLGDLGTHDALCRRLAKFSQCAIVAVDYRRAPEAKFPAALEDCFAALQHLATRAPDLSIDPGRIAVAGDSAGGNLAAAVALRSRLQQGPDVAFQLLIYPVIEPNFQSSSYREFAEGYGLRRGVMRWFWQQYLSGAADRENPLAVPALAHDLSRLPPAHVVTAEYDVLREEGERYARLLQAAGVPVRVERYPGMLHGFVHFAGAFDVGLLAAERLGQVLQAALHSEAVSWPGKFTPGTNQARK